MPSDKWCCVRKEIWETIDMKFRVHAEEMDENEAWVTVDRTEGWSIGGWRITNGDWVWKDGWKKCLRERIEKETF